MRENLEFFRSHTTHLEEVTFVLTSKHILSVDERDRMVNLMNYVITLKF